MPNHDRFECQTAIDSDAILQLNDRFLLPESQQKNLAELKRSFLDPALKQINEKTPLLAKYSIDDSGKFLFSIIDKQNPV
ncbi:replication initiation protein [Escherichia coli]|uniref:replication initiation protein n=1 Tax=Escherichia coli TaxID=562 RepID=UPI00109386FD|nr:replication initiation protein [Escherichia coli]TGX19578.1 RepB family plasmid replication initiator protein [Escherichia coli]